ncbi:MAG: manganese/iron superoxide dismutase, superoxide dismutase, Fe-Mn family [Armatimonadetes bacterium CSP1-3]|nr:MAG: manganese/iron superoxide dismutase, superoxide dismutase, Fe-Mn family [Armatimonadetes bacterium CSP1-3]
MAKYEAKKFRSFEVELDGISKKAMEEHYKLYQGYVNKANEITEKLAALDKDPAKANPTYSDIRELKVEYTRAVGGVKNHENYFAVLGGKGGNPSGKLLKLIERDFGSFENWQKDLKATGIAARGWAWLAYDWDAGHLFNYIGDEQNTFPIWNASVVLAMDVFEHAYYMDFGTGKAAYIDAFFRNIDWTLPEQVAKDVLPDGM